MSDLWLIAYERIPELFDSGELDADGVRDALKKLGFDADEIEDHINTLLSDEGNEVAQ